MDSGECQGIPKPNCAEFRETVFLGHYRDTESTSKVSTKTSPRPRNPEEKIPPNSRPNSRVESDGIPMNLNYLQFRQPTEVPDVITSTGIPNCRKTVDSRFWR